jgi:branched-chain amino acid aminotransferase
MLISFNGVLTHSDDKLFNASSRIYKYGDGFFESIKIINKKPQLIELHYDRILRASKLFHLPLSDKWTLDYFTEHLEWLCLKNGFINARCRIVFYRESEGFYAPARDKTSFLIEVSESDPRYKLNDIGYKLGAYGQILKASNFVSFFKPLSAINYVLAGIFARDNHYDSVVLFNEAGNICETFNANIFMISNGVVHTPPLSEYCLDGVMRQYIINQMKALEIPFSEQAITEEDLKNADEVFLSNATKGIVWVESFEQSFYQFNQTFELHSKIFGI